MNRARTTGLSLLAIGQLASSAALAADPGPSDPALDAPAQRRGGLVVGAGGGFALGTASGYPNDIQKVGLPEYYAAGGLMPGYSGEAFVMGALADVFNFGLFFGTTGLATSDWSMTAYAGGFRLEAFPLFAVRPALRDLGFMAQFGVGSAKLDPARGTYQGAAGAQSILGAGVFYELRPVGHFTVAPSVEYNYISASSLDASWLQVGVRVAWYSGPASK